MPAFAGMEGRLEHIEEGIGVHSDGSKVIDTDFPPAGFIRKIRYEECR